MPVGLDSFTLLLRRLSPNVKFKRFAKNFKIKISKICSTVIVRIGEKLGGVAI